MMERRFLSGVAGLIGAGLISLVAPTDASACGGFFCDGQQPVNQAAERIIFSDNPDGTVTAVVQILYQGPSESFAWVLPVPSVPEISVSSNLAFTRLQNATNPQYTMQTTVEGECAEEEFDFANAGGNNSAPESSNNANGVNNSDPVQVLDQGAVGPYDYVVIDVDDQIADPAQSAVDWLETNGYDVTAMGPEVMRPYIEDGMFLLAFRLTKQAESGDIRPVVLNYETDVPMIPIKLTAVAANENMGVLVWVMGEDRSIPINYRSLEINDTLINWFNPGSNYNDVINRAADEAMGQGFVTEFAGANDIAEERVFSLNDEQQWEYFSTTDWTGREAQLVEETWNVYAADFMGMWDGWPETINGFFGGLTPEERQSIIECAPCDRGLIPTSFDPAAYLSELETNVVKPMQETQAILDSRPYMTRLYTTMSAAEMTVDPVFDFNPDLADQTNQHTAERIIECNSSVTRFEAPWRAIMPDGAIVRGTGNGWPLNADDAAIPANRRVLQDSTEGEPEVVEDNVATIQQALTERNAQVPGSVSGGQVGDGEKSSADSCATVGGGTFSFLAMLGLGFFGLRRRREDA